MRSTKDPTYSSWAAMKQRCTNPKNIGFAGYGGRGITVCERWMNSFDAFREDMGERPDGKTLDREDGERGYEPGNCRWATPYEQAQNRRPGLGHNRPPSSPRKFKRTCPETGQRFETTTHDRLFSTDAAKAAFHNRSSKIGRSLVPLALAWRDGRNINGTSPEARALRASAGRAFNEMCALLDAAIREDKAAERMPKIDYLRRRNTLQGTLRAEEKIETHRANDERAARAAARAAKDAAKAKPEEQAP